MNISQLKENIKNFINQIDNFDITKLYPINPNAQLWQNITREETQVFVDDIINSLNLLKDNLFLLDKVGFNYVNSINTHLQNFINQFNPLVSIDPQSIINQHHNSLNQLQGLNNLLRNSGLYFEIRFIDIEETKKNISKYKKVIEKDYNEIDKILKDAKEKGENNKLLKISTFIDTKATENNKLSYIFLIAFFISLFILIIFVINPFFESFLNYIFNKNSLLNLEIYLGKLPLVIFLTFLSGLFYSLFFKYQSISRSYSHKGAVARSLSEYGEHFFADINKVEDKKIKDGLRSEIIKFKIKTTEDIFRLPISEKEELRFQAKIANNGLEFGKQNG